jgi:hypothetical protein
MLDLVSDTTFNYFNRFLAKLAARHPYKFQQQ